MSKVFLIALIVVGVLSAAGTGCQQAGETVAEAGEMECSVTCDSAKDGAECVVTCEGAAGKTEHTITCDGETEGGEMTVTCQAGEKGDVTCTVSCSDDACTGDCSTCEMTVTCTHAEGEECTCTVEKTTGCPGAAKLAESGGTCPSKTAGTCPRAAAAKEVAEDAS